MPYELSTTSTENPAAYSGGVFKMPSIELWNLPNWAIEEPERPTGEYLSFEWCRRYPSAYLAHHIQLIPPQTATVPSEWWSLAARFVCHVLVDEIPDRGLPELYESLGNIHEFYLAEPERTPLLPSVQRIDAAWGVTAERPSFQLEPETED